MTVLRRRRTTVPRASIERNVAPKIFIPHQVTAVAKEQDAMGIPAEDRPELFWLVDPNDYLRPIVFDANDARWDKSHRRD